jgi:hypothetical protein
MLRTASTIEEEARENKYEQTMRLMAARVREQATTWAATGNTFW